MAATQLNVSDVHIERLIIESASGKYDLVPHLDELNIYEDIFSNSVKGDITLNDAYNLPYKLPIVGEETIDCKIRMTGDSGSDEPFRFLDPPKFYIYELSDRYSLEDPESGFGPIKAQRYSLNFVSEQFMSNHHSRVSKAYTNMTADEIVGDIWSNYLDDGKGDLIVTDAIRGEYCIIPNWHPHEAFNWLASRAQAEKKSAVITDAVPAVEPEITIVGAEVYPLPELVIVTVAIAPPLSV